jgi:SagB-type dehydrogenase family enzyme
MNHKLLRMISFLWLLASLPLVAAEPEPVVLPPPQTAGGRPVMQVLQDRKSIREFRPTALPVQTLSNLLWAGFGINRPDGRRTAPSAMNSQEIDLYVALAEGTYVYEARDHRLRLVATGDVRAKTSGQEQAKTAPVVLMFVADLSRLTKAKPEERERYAWIDTGYISQNVYLFCASEGLASVAYELDPTRLPELLKLKPEQRLVLAQAVGLPK